MTQKQHEALSLPLSERVDYLTVVASMAGADVVLETAERDRLRALCAELGLPEQETKEVLTASETATAKVERHLERLRASPLRFALLTDCVSLAHADGEYREEERQEIRVLQRTLDVTDEQLAAIEDYVSGLRGAAAGDGDAERRGREIASKLASVGVPVGVVATASALGLQLAGASTGLAAFGIGLGVASGFGAVLGLGLGTYMGVRWLKEKLAAK